MSARHGVFVYISAGLISVDTVALCCLVVGRTRSPRPDGGGTFDHGRRDALYTQALQPQHGYQLLSHYQDISRPVRRQLTVFSHLILSSFYVCC